MHNRIPREETIAIVFFAMFFMFIGAAGGYSARAISSRDKFLVATAIKAFTEADLKQQQINQIINEGSKDLKGAKK